MPTPASTPTPAKPVSSTINIGKLVDDRVKKLGWPQLPTPVRDALVAKYTEQAQALVDNGLKDWSVILAVAAKVDPSKSAPVPPPR